ncbi:dihydropteroate synthase [Algimonas arctica]|uniref:Dihydropteroate synthase n=1 Tax=Algimonas arctica TaxID=1479486 RepID=A0A8J3CPL2_9PROT|nr:dihydropteroate synthase [Algimonas arctica]GHA82452.1 dihydropteroate synthase [Algimonas arctica]
MFRRPKIMGILNVTPDSFSDGGQFSDLDAAVRHARQLIDQGADIIDIGGESTRPGARLVPWTEERDRVIPVIRAIRTATQDDDPGPLISIDTRKPEVAEAAILTGADIWNDVSALTYSNDSVALAANLDCPIILMHAQGTPDTMQDRPSYDDPVDEVLAYLSDRIAICVAAGIDRDQITIDPGIGFGKRLEDNLAILRHTAKFAALAPTLIGTSRKSFIQKIDGSPVEQRLGGSLASMLYAANEGAAVLRVHDVAETMQALRVWEGIENE